MTVVRIHGLDRLMAKLGPALIGKPLRNFLERSLRRVEGLAKPDAPVDTGQLRNSLAVEIDSAEVPMWGKFGTDKPQGMFMEYGTGKFYDGPGSGKGSHWPPGDALGVWARRHGFASGFQVATIIGKRGGLKPRRFMRNAVKEAAHDFKRFIDKFAQEVREAWESRG